MPDEQILHSKLAPAERHPLAVDRRAALDWLDATVGSDGSAVLSALPGSGRLELLARWAEDRSPHPTVWLRLDAWDDLARFIRHLIATLGQVDDRIGAEVVDHVAKGADAVRQLIVPALAAACERYGDPFTVVVHGVDRLRDPEAIGALRVTQRYRPPNVRLIWLSDDDEAAAFRAADGVTEIPRIRADALAFDRDAVTGMYERAGVSATAEQVDGLVQATGGWALTVLHWVAAAEAAGRFVVPDVADDDLAERIERTVLASQPPELRALVSDLAIVGPATVSQFEQVTDQSDVAGDLDRLRRRHLVTRRGGRWSVATPLRAHLRQDRQGHQPTTAIVLRRRMARLLAEAGDARSALDLLAGAGDLQARARLLLERHRQWSALGEPAVETHAADALIHAPAHVELHLVRAWYGVFNADPHEVQPLLASIERTPLTGARADRARSELSFLRGVLARRTGRFADAVAEAEAGTTIGFRLDPTDPDLTEWPYLAVMPTTVELYLGHFRFHAGELAAARDDLLMANAARSWSPPALAALHGVLGMIGWIEDDASGQIHAAIGASNVGDRLDGNTHLAAAALALTGAGPDAAHMASRYRTEGPAVGEPIATVLVHVLSALRSADPARARTELASARRVADGCPQPGVLPAIVARAGTLVGGSDDAPELGEPLSDGERRVLRALRGDLTEREIAAELHLSHNTVRTYRRRAYRKLGVSSRRDAVARLAALESGSEPRSGGSAGA